MSSCGFCYNIETPFKCGKCRKRHYCSKECQKKDWTSGGHKHWCGVAGEVGFDFEIRETEQGFGLGVFALRQFNKDDKIMAERYVLSTKGGISMIIPSLTTLPSSIQDAVIALAPVDSASMEEKFDLNAMSCSSGGDLSGLFINMSRCNHDCSGNSVHYFVDRHNVKILIASKPISIGEEITFSYINNHRENKFLFTSKWKFSCDCSVCCDPAKESMLQEMQTLDDQILEFGESGQVPKAIAAAKRLLDLYDATKSPTVDYSRTYYDLFALNVTRQGKLAEAKKYIKLAYEAECAIYAGCKDEKCGYIEKYKRYMVNPSLHHNYSYR